MRRTRSGQRSSVFKLVEQLVGEAGDAQEPLRQKPLLDQRARAPAAAVDHLLVGEHGVLDRVPIDPGFAAIGQVRREEVEKHLLLVPVIFRMAGRDLAAPIIGEAHALQLAAHHRDVVVGPARGMVAARHRRVLGGQPERVPAHRMQNVEALRALVARDHVAHRVVAHMARHGVCRRDRETSPARSISAARGRSRPRKCRFSPRPTATSPRSPWRCSAAAGDPYSSWGRGLRGKAAHATWTRCSAASGGRASGSRSRGRCRSPGRPGHPPTARCRRASGGTRWRARHRPAVRGRG